MNQIVLVPVAILSIILLLSAPIAVDTAGTCADNGNLTRCCAVSGCGWFECKGSGDNTNVTVCLDPTNTTAIETECSGSTDDADKKTKCPVAPPTPATCQNLNSSSCCAGGDDKLTGCGLFKCGTETSCWNSTDTGGFETECVKKGNTTDLVNTCETPTETCSIQTVNSTCCNNTGCGWYMCESADKSLSGEGKCVLNTTSTPITCSDPTKAQDTCAVTPTPTPAPIVGKCASLTTQETCCNTTSGSTCKWINCNGTLECMENDASTDACLVKDSLCGSSTPSPVTTPAATTPAPTTQAPAPASNTGMQHFDGASFVGGIILAVGVIAIAFFGCKFYKARKERNYHTL